MDNVRAGRARLLYFLADRQASDYFTALGYEPHKEEEEEEEEEEEGLFKANAVRSTANAAASTSSMHRCSIGLTCAQAAAIRGASHVARRHAAVPRALQLRVALDNWDRNNVHERVRAGYLFHTGDGHGAAGSCRTTVLQSSTNIVPNRPK